jgi:uncharacterized protein YjgD (DUF1641 family)
MGTLESIGINREGLGHMLSDKSLVVPPYQRSYAWKRRHVEQLLEDFAGALQVKASGASGEYFLGSIVTIKRDDENTLEVVDGQQRLATTSIAIAAIRDHFLRERDERQAKHLEDTYLWVYDPDTREDVPRLALSAEDNDFYVQSILTRPQLRKRGLRPEAESHRRIHRAYRLSVARFADVAKGFAKPQAEKALLGWVSFLRDHARVIHVTVEDSSDAFVIFETLNDRGLELSTADLLKNYLFRLARERVEEVKDRWIKMVGALETVTHKSMTVDYIRQLWSSIHGVARKRDLFYQIKQEVANKTAAVELSTTLEGNAKLYAAILNPSHEMWARFGTPARQAIATLRILRMERVRPLLLAIMEAFPDAEIKKALRFIVSAAVRLIIAGGSPGPVETALLKASVKVRKNDIENTIDLARNLSPIIATDHVFEGRFAVARVKNAQMARYYLRALEEALVTKHPMVFVVSDNEEKANLEHILPERGREQDWSHVPSEKADELCRRIGNLLLLDPKVNARLTSGPFAEKVKVYARAENTRLAKMLAERYGSSQWGEDQINEWQAELAKLAVKAWTLSVK